MHNYGIRITFLSILQATFYLKFLFGLLFELVFGANHHAIPAVFADGFLGTLRARITDQIQLAVNQAAVLAALMHVNQHFSGAEVPAPLHASLNQLFSLLNRVDWPIGSKARGHGAQYEQESEFHCFVLS